MNERLTELYRASRPKEALASQDEFKSANALLGSDVEKFARLLIEECAWLVDENDISLPYGTFGELIKQHFGIEE